MSRPQNQTPRDPHDFKPDDALVNQLSKLGKALGHPIRVQIAATLLKVDEAGPKEIAEIIEKPLGTVSYHVRYLSNLGLITLERLVPRRGALEHKYSLDDALRRALPAAASALDADRPKVAGRRRARSPQRLKRGAAKK